MPTSLRPTAWRHAARLALVLLVAACGNGSAGREDAADPGLDPGAGAESGSGSGAALAPAPDAGAAYAAVAARLAAGAGRPEPLTEYATTQQRRALEQARVLLQQLSLAPDDADTRVRLARIYQQSMLPGRALQVLGPVFAEPEVSDEALFLAASCLHVQNELDGALVLLERLLAAQPTHRAALELAAGILRRLGRLDEACALARRGLEAHPFAAGLELPLAVAARDAGDLVEAERRLARAVENDPELLEARYLHARVLRELGRDDEAEVEEAEHARLVRLDDLGLPPGLPEEERLLALARSYRAAGEPERAEDELVRVLARAPNAEARALLGEIWRELGRDVEAEGAELERRYPHLADGE